MYFISKKTIFFTVVSSLTLLKASQEPYFMRNPYSLTSVTNPVSREKRISCEKDFRDKAADLQASSTGGETSAASTPSFLDRSHPFDRMVELQRAAFKRLFSDIQAYQFPNWQDAKFLELHKSLSELILNNKISQSEFTSIPPVQCIALSLPLFLNIQYSDQFLSEYVANIKQIEDCTQKNKFGKYARNLSIETQLLINQIAERYYFIKNDKEDLLRIKISIANCYRLLKQNELAFKKGMESLELSLTINPRKTGSILFGIMTAFYHFSDCRSGDYHPRRRNKELEDSMKEALIQHHSTITKTEKSYEQFHILEFFGFTWPEDRAQAIVWNEAIFNKRFV
jgi:hypothetical protein